MTIKKFLIACGIAVAVAVGSIVLLVGAVVIVGTLTQTDGPPAAVERPPAPQVTVEAAPADRHAHLHRIIQGTRELCPELVSAKQIAARGGATVWSVDCSAGKTFAVTVAANQQPKVVPCPFGTECALPSPARPDSPAGRAPSANARPAIASSTPASPRPGLTYANYQRISEGMTYRQVVAILGSEGKELSRSDLAGYSTVMYSWSRWTGANMNATFQNGSLVMKAQYGLD